MLINYVIAYLGNLGLLQILRSQRRTVFSEIQNGLAFLFPKKYFANNESIADLFSAICSFFFLWKFTQIHSCFAARFLWETRSYKGILVGLKMHPKRINGPPLWAFHITWAVVLAHNILQAVTVTAEL